MTVFNFRRSSLASVAFALLGPALVLGQSTTEPIRIAFLAIRTGPLAARGKQMESA
ncbi:MAG: hypothetical protein M3Z29_01880 [Pseudomonadota bacterium]|nr:hypothetical protein [Pseudomonadota bacterium]